MSPHKPDEWPRLFEPNLNARELDAVVALYEPQARFVGQFGEPVVGRERIRKVLAGMIGAKTRLHSRVVTEVTFDDIALLYTDFEGTTVDRSGKPVAIHYRAVEILRCQPDGTWKLIVGDPNGRERDVGQGGLG
jgi:ketosteroid isomerase-like protein